MSTRELRPGSWNILTVLDQAPGLKVLADTLNELVEDGHPVAVATADLKYSNGLYRFEENHPDRFVQFGVSEQNMVSAAAGMAAVGVVPHVATFASFLALLCCEQIRTDIAYTGLPVRLIGTHAGITLGFYGTSHHAIEDLAIMRAIPALDVIAPADATTLRAALRWYIDYPGPAYFRIGRGREPDCYIEGELEFERGKAIVHSAGADLTIVATGSMVHPAIAATEELRRQGYSIGFIDMHTIKPLDDAAVSAAAQRAPLMMSVEEHNVLGGLGGALAEVLADQGTPCRLHRHGMKDEYSLIGPPTHLYRHYRLDSDGIAKEAREFIELAQAS